jgi:hypothetical protein
MKKLLSLPNNLVDCFHEIENVDTKDWFCTSDPIGKKLGSGGGTAFLLQSCYNQNQDSQTFEHCLLLKNVYFCMLVDKVVDCQDMRKW